MSSDAFQIALGQKLLPKPEDSGITLEQAALWYGANVSPTKSYFAFHWEPARLKELCAQFPGMALSDVGLTQLLEYRTKVLRGGLDPQTVNRRLTLVKSFFKNCHERGLIATNPTAGLKKLRVPERDTLQVLSDEEQEKVIAAAQPWLAWVLWGYSRTGARRKELLQVRWRHVNFQDGYLVLEGTSTKNRKTRKVPLSQASLLRFQAKREEEKAQGRGRPDDLVFLTFLGRSICPNQLTRYVKKLMKSVLKRPNGALHIWRHSFLTKLVQVADIESARQIAGHSSVVITQRYCHANDLTKRAAVEALEARSVRGEGNPLPEALPVPRDCRGPSALAMTGFGDGPSGAGCDSSRTPVATGGDARK